MPAEQVSDASWAQLAAVLAHSIGLHFPAERQADLRRGIATAAPELGFATPSSCVDWLLSKAPSPSQLSTLADHLVVGETYFFRERKTLEALRSTILPQLLHRPGRERCLRLWSAACSTGEEAYSLAILAQELLGHRQDWQVKILATDINERSLHKAVTGHYGEWSFRDCPVEFKQRYFSRTPDQRFSIRAEIKHSVTFVQMNLAGDDFASRAHEAAAMDVILCRNLLMYFTPSEAQRLIARLRDALTDDGWLAVSPTECSQSLFAGFETVNFPGAILYRKCRATAVTTPAALVQPLFTPRLTTPAAAGLERLPYTSPMPPQKSAAQVTAGPALKREALDTPESAALSDLTQTMANQGELAGALSVSERWVAADKADPRAHYLQAIILLEKGERSAARQALQRAIYLRPDFAVAHFALGNLSRAETRAADAHRHYTNALRLLRARPADEPLAEFDGMTAGRLVQLVTAALTHSERDPAVTPP